METPNISINRPISRKPSAPTTQPDITHYEKESGAASAPRHNSESRGSLELYAGTGKIRTERPAVRGNNIDITV